MCAGVCASPLEVVKTCDSCKMRIKVQQAENHFYILHLSTELTETEPIQLQTAFDQLLESESVEMVASSELCKENPNEDCSAFVDVLLQQGLPLLITAATADPFLAQVPFSS